MNKSAFYFLCATIGLAIIALALIALPESGITISGKPLFFAILCAGFGIIAALSQTFREKVKHLCCDYDWADESIRLYNAIPKIYRKSFWYLFGFINLAFLFHTINFMWGNQDWAAVRSAVDIKAGLEEGRFAAYWLQEAIFDGKILPVINNLFSFAALSLGAVLLCYYWQLPKKSTYYIMTGLFMLITPYTLSWLYFAKNMLGNLALPAIVLGGLLLSERRESSIYKAYAYNLTAILLFIMALGTYLPVINFIGVTVLGKIFLKTVFADISLKDAIKRTLQTLVNLTTASFIYAFIIIILKDNATKTDSYNTTLAPLGTMVARLPEFLWEVVTQFTTALPFTDIFYKAAYLIIALAALFALIIKAPNAKAAGRGLIIIPFILLASRLTFLLAAPSEETAGTLMRVDFYGLPTVYALMLAVIFKLGGDYLKRFGLVLGFIIIFMGFVRIAYGLKVWKFGFDAEFKMTEGIITRLEKLPDFNIDRQYKLLQIGEASLRSKFYIKTPYEEKSNELLEWSYYPEGNAKDAYNFYYQADFLEADASLKAAASTPAIKEYLLNKARAWPAPESLYIYGNYIVIIIDDAGLAKAQHELSR